MIFIKTKGYMLRRLIHYNSKMLSLEFNSGCFCWVKRAVNNVAHTLSDVLFDLFWMKTSISQKRNALRRATKCKHLKRSCPRTFFFPQSTTLYILFQISTWCCQSKCLFQHVNGSIMIPIWQIWKWKWKCDSVYSTLIFGFLEISIET